MSKFLENNYNLIIGFINGLAIGISITSLVFSHYAHADQPSISLTQGQPAPYSGVLVDPARVQRIDNLQLDYDHLTKLDSLKDEDVKILNDRVNNLSKVNEALNDKVISQDSNSTWKLVGMFTLGAVITGVFSYGAFRLAK